MANQGPLVRVDRGDGNLIKLTPKEAEAYIAANHGAKVVGTPPPPSDDVPMPQASESASPKYEEMTLPELRDYADSHGVDLTDATRKADVIERIQAAQGAPAAAE